MPTNVRQVSYSTARQWVQPIAFFVFGLVLGCVSRWARGGGPIHWEMIAAILLLGAAMLVSTLLHYRERVLPATLGSLADVTGLWVGFPLGWFWVHGEVWDDLIALVLGGWMCGIVGVSIVLAVMRHRATITVGPHCPGCGYYLYGLTEQVCPECGRPFTLEELGITVGDLGAAGHVITDSPGTSGSEKSA